LPQCRQSTFGFREAEEILQTIDGDVPLRFGIGDHDAQGRPNARRRGTRGHRREENRIRSASGHALDAHDGGRCATGGQRCGNALLKPNVILLARERQTPAGQTDAVSARVQHRRLRVGVDNPALFVEQENGRRTPVEKVIQRLDHREDVQIKRHSE